MVQTRGRSRRQQPDDEKESAVRKKTKAKRSKAAEPSPVINEDDSNDNAETAEEQEAPSLFVLDREGGEDQIPLPTEEVRDEILPEKTPWTKSKKTKAEKNELTRLIAGYTAPMQLNASSLDKFRSSNGIKGLQQRAQRVDASTRDFVVEASKKYTDAMQNSSNRLLSRSYADSYSSFKKGKKRAPDKTAGDKWFGMKPHELTDELKADLNVIRNRSYLDPKKFYKSSDKPSKFVQMGTVIEGASEYYSSRLTKKQRRNNLTEEIMADPESADYARKKFQKMSREGNEKARKRARVHRPKRGKRGF